MRAIEKPFKPETLPSLVAEELERFRAGAEENKLKDGDRKAA